MTTKQPDIAALKLEAARMFALARMRAEEEREAAAIRQRTAHDRLREVLDQPAVYFTIGPPLPRYVCTVTRSMRTDPGAGFDAIAVDNPAEWYHPDLGRRRTYYRVDDIRYDENGEPIRDTFDGRACRFCGYVVVVE